MRRWTAPILVVTLAACAEHETPAPPPAADTTAAVETPAVVDSAPAAPATAVLDEQGLTPVRAGMSVDELRRALGGVLTLADAEDPDPKACRYARSDALGGARIMLEGTQVVRVEADSSVATALGARIGSEEAEVMRLYPAARVLPHHYTSGHYLVVIPGAPADTLHRLVFETDGQRVTALRGGLYPPVEYVEGCS